MEPTKITNTPDRCLATGVELWVKDDGTLNWCDDECAVCGREHIYPAGDHSDDPRRALGPQTPPCAKPEPGSPLAVAAEALNLSFGTVVLFELEPLETADAMKLVRLMGFAGLLENAGHGDDVTGIEGVSA
jgi:hypothetical protein